MKSALNLYIHSFKHCVNASFNLYIAPGGLEIFPDFTGDLVATGASIPQGNGLPKFNFIWLALYFMYC
jgi:hypothetical protein